ncbi:MAG: hypothetical protein ABI972_06895 [Acidobacteriota bacterium]
MRNQVIACLIAGLAGYAAGYLPQHSELSAANTQLSQTAKQLSEEKQARALADFRNSTALLHTEVSKSNFSTAGESASKLFTSLRTFTNEAPEPVRQRLESVLGGRDAIVAAIAKADPAAAGLIESMFLQLQGI